MKKPNRNERKIGGKKDEEGKNKEDTDVRSNA